MMARISRPFRLWGEVRDYEIASRVKSPQTHSEKLKGLEVLHRRAALLGMEHSNWHVRKKTVAACLLQRLPPIGDFQFESSKSVIDVANKVLGEAMRNSLACITFFPSDRNNISYPVSVCRDLTSKYHRVALGVVWKRRESGLIGPRKSKCKPILWAF